jgi:hypothetical protein
MSRHRRDPDEAERELLLRYGIEPNPHADHFHEQELADRIREQASLAPGHHAAWQLARSIRDIGHPLYELPNAPATAHASARRAGDLPRCPRRRGSPPRHRRARAGRGPGRGRGALRGRGAPRAARGGARTKGRLMPRADDRRYSRGRLPARGATRHGLALGDWRARRRKRPRRRR